MRPPLNAGKTASSRRRTASATRFNEAPAERGGKPRRTRHPCASGSCFNEAPAERGGKRRVERGERFAVETLQGASMRPPLNAGENATPSCRALGNELASMRPPLNAGENGCMCGGMFGTNLLQ